ncbi:MAG: epoxyqueuosine reductase [Candidatus Thorarchaeota archaeon]|nr:MAG: epoxyqueuosine reductase [Candidatus Thorarchaeota archaeon]
MVAKDYNRLHMHFARWFAMVLDNPQKAILTKRVKSRAIDAGFVSVGVAEVDRLRELYYGWAGEVREIFRPEKELPSTRSVVVMAYSIPDHGYFLNIPAPRLRSSEKHQESKGPGHNSYVYEVMKNKAWRVVEYLRDEGFETKWSVGIPLKTTGVLCGIGYQGKSSLLVTPSHGPRVDLIAILTSAELNPDVPFERDLCGTCEKCIIACPTNAIEPYRLRINHCMVYPLECPDSTEVPDSVREKADQLITRPTRSSFIQCSRCMDVCPIGR